VFRRRAQETHAAAAEAVPGLGLVLNPAGRPARGSFEIALEARDGAEPVEVWSGLRRGPPRRLKFPEPEEIAESVAKSVAKA
jgi:selT/selW/selH-like putative selenoprotein